MEKLLESTNLLAGLIILLAMHLIMKLAEFVWDIVKKKTELTEKNIDNLITALATNSEALHRLEERMRTAENHLEDIFRQRESIRRLFIAVKSLAGENWTDIRKNMEDDLTA